MRRLDTDTPMRATRTPACRRTICSEKQGTENESQCDPMATYPKAEEGSAR